MGGFILAPSLLAARLRLRRDAQSACWSLSRPLAFSIIAPIAGYVAVQAGERFAAIVGSLAVVGSMVLFAAVGGARATRSSSAALVLSGIGMGVSSPSIAASVANAVDEASLGIASAAQQLMTQVGLVAGIQLMRPCRPRATYRSAYVLGAGVALLAVVCASFVQSAKRDGERRSTRRSA